MGKERLQQRPQRRVRLRDVAELAACSTATVSRALNAPHTVRPAIRERVLSATEKLGYLPNSAARALRSHRTRIIGAVIPTLNHAIYARLVDALQQRLGQSGYALLVTKSEYDVHEELEQTRILLERGAEGIALVGDSHDPALYKLLGAYHAPYINTYVYNPESGHPCVGFDNRQAAAQAAEFLISLGHVQIGMIAGVTTDNDRAAGRVAGVRSALEAHGLMLPDALVIERFYTIEGGREALRLLLAADPPPTAAVCGSDVLAFGALSECADLGVAVPADFSIVGFDNQEFAPHLKPPLTTIEVPAAEMGQRAGDYLMRRLQNKSALQFTQLEAKLVARRTAAPPPRTGAHASLAMSVGSVGTAGSHC